MGEQVENGGDCQQRDDDDDNRLDGLEFCLAHDLPDDTALVRFEDAPPAAVDAAIGTFAAPFSHALFEIAAMAWLDAFRLAGGAEDAGAHLALFGK